MQRVVDEAKYVLAILRRTRDQMTSNPSLFDPGAQQRIAEEIARIEDVLRSAQSELMVGSAEQKFKAA
jgi:hypothetical protein